MELYLLGTFQAIASEKSFSRAAEKLLRTQPAFRSPYSAWKQNWVKS